MTEEAMTLIERLNNPQWVHGGGAAPNLDTYQTTKDMAEAAIMIATQKIELRCLRGALATIFAEASEALQ